MADNRAGEIDHRAESFSDFMAEFIEESDRAAVILGASKVEALLGEILDKFLLPTASTTDELLDGESPLGTFSSRIKACHRLGLIDDQFAKLLNIFRRLRNGFAHEITSSSLSTGSARDRVAAMAEPFVREEYFAFLRSNVASQMTKSESDSGVIFRAVLALFHIHLAVIHGSVEPVERLRADGICEACKKLSELQTGDKKEMEEDASPTH